MKKIAILLIALIVIGITMLGCPGNGGNGGSGSGGGNGYVPSPPSPAAFSLSNLLTEPAKILPGETATISATVSNTGGSQGTYSANLVVNGVEVETKDIALASGNTSDITFQITRDNPGVYTVELGGSKVVLKVGVELIAFSSNRDGDYDIYVMNSDGSRVLKITWWDFVFSIDGDPSWSPDGQKLAFSSDIEGDSEIYVMYSDGSNVMRLTNSTGSDIGPVWSPDGEKIAFETTRDGNWEIYVMNSDGLNVINITNAASRDQLISWSPDGEKIAFYSTRDGNAEIYVMDADGSSVERLTDNPAIDISPVWSPDGEKIAFDSDRDGNYEIYVMNSDGSNVVRLTDNPRDDGWVSWTLAPGQVGIPGETIADLLLQYDVLPLIMASEALYNLDCQDRNVVDSEVMSIEANGVWTEHWIVDSCGVITSYKIVFTPDGQGGTYASVTRIEN